MPREEILPFTVMNEEQAERLNEKEKEKEDEKIRTDDRARAMLESKEVRTIGDKELNQQETAEDKIGQKERETGEGEKILEMSSRGSKKQKQKETNILEATNKGDKQSHDQKNKEKGDEKEMEESAEGKSGIPEAHVTQEKEGLKSFRQAALHDGQKPSQERPEREDENEKKKSSATKREGSKERRSRGAL